MADAYPSNIAPGLTPGLTATPYDVVATDSSKPIFVILKGGFYETVLGAASRARVDLPYYDGSTTRDELDAGFVGRGPVSIFNGSNTPEVVTGDFSTQTSTTDVATFPDSILKTQQESDSFTHTPPHQNVLAKTYVRYYSAANGTGNVVGEFDVTVYRGEGGRIPQYYGSVPPTYTTS